MASVCLSVFWEGGLPVCLGIPSALSSYPLYPQGLSDYGPLVPHVPSYLLPSVRRIGTALCLGAVEEQASTLKSFLITSTGMSSEAEVISLWGTWSWESFFPVGLCITVPKGRKPTLKDDSSPSALAYHRSMRVPDEGDRILGHNSQDWPGR